MVHGQNTNGTWAKYEWYMMIIPNENCLFNFPSSACEVE